MSIAAADLILTVPIIYGLVRGLFRGFFKEMASIIGIILSVVAIRLWATPVAEFLQDFVDMSPTISMALAGLAIFVGVGVVIRTILLLINNALNSMGLGLLNRLAGMLFGGLKFLLVVSILVNLLALVTLPGTHEKRGTIESSQFYEPIKNAAPKLLPFFPKEKFMELIKTAIDTQEEATKDLQSDASGRQDSAKVREQDRKFSNKGER